MTHAFILPPNSVASVLLDLAALIQEDLSDNPKSVIYDTREADKLAKTATKILPEISYQEFCEVARYLDQDGFTYLAYLARQTSTLYFLLRLAPLYTARERTGVGKKLDLLHGARLTRDDLFPEKVIPEGPVAATHKLLANYLTESWNWYATNRDVSQYVVARERLYFLIREVVAQYGDWVWPYMHHYESDVHVDSMLSLLETERVV